MFFGPRDGDLERQVGVIARVGQSSLFAVNNVRLDLAVGTEYLLTSKPDSADTVEPETANDL